MEAIKTIDITKKYKNLTAAHFIAGYMLPILLIAILLSVICYAVAVLLGLPVTVKQVGGICGALLTNLTAWLSRSWFDLDLVGGVFKRIAYCLPFLHAVEAERAILNGSYAELFSHIWWVIGYAAGIAILSILFFLRQMKQQ